MINEQSTPYGFLSAGGQMGERIRNTDWSKTPLGDVSCWSSSFISALGICLNSNFPIAIYWGEELTLLYNDAWSPIPGNKHPWALGKPAKEVWPEIWNAIEPQFEKAFKGIPGGSKDALLPMKRHGYREECYFDFTFTPIHGEDGKVAGVFNAVIETTYRVISERRNNFIKTLSLRIAGLQTVEQVLVDSLRLISTMHHDIPCCILYKYDGEKIQVLHSAKAVEGMRPKENAVLPFDVIKKSGEPFFIKDLSEFFDPLPECTWNEAPVEGFVVPLKETTGNAETFLCFTLSPRIRFNDDYKLFLESIGSAISTVLQTITSLETERNRVQALEAIDKAKTVFFSNISHEFRTPLTLMLGTLEEILRNGNEQPQNQELLKMTHRNAMRLLKLVNALLDFSRMESNRQKAAFVRTNLGVLTKNLAGNFRSMIEKAGLQFFVEAGDTLEAVYVDRTMWEKIVFNLLSNAYKYTLSGYIKIRLSAEEQQLVMEVIDTGAGIPEKELPLIFQRFHRVENTAGRTFEGTGIGLSLVKEMTALHGGTVSVSSTEGKGSTFKITILTGKDHLPPDQVYEKDDEAIEATEEIFIDEPHQLLSIEATEEVLSNANKDEAVIENKRSVLIVDDNKDMRQYIQSLLQKDFNVITAVNGRDALEKIQKSRPVLILSDVMMPLMDGIELLRAIKQNMMTANIPIILLTARAGEESKIDGFATGADDYLVKPFSSRELLSRVHAQIDIAERRVQTENRIKEILTQLPAGISIVEGENYTYTMANTLYQKISGRSSEQLIGKALKEVFPELEKQGIYELLDEVYHTGKPFTTIEEEIILLDNGKPKTGYYDFVFHPIRNYEGQINAIMMFVIETTNSVLARKKLEVFSEELEQKDAKKDEFIGIASHELKTPLTVTKGYMQLIEGMTLQSGFTSIIPFIGKANAALERLNNLISDLLDVTKIQHGKLQFKFADFDFNELVAETTEYIQQTSPSHTLRTHYGNQIKMIEGDRERLRLVLLNLLSNAVKYSAEKTTVDVEIKNTKKDIMVKVSDTGIGIARADLSKVFDRFYRAQNADANYQGLGIGLFLAAEIIRNHKGNIWAESEEGKGSNFYFSLPVKQTIPVVADVPAL